MLQLSPALTSAIRAMHGESDDNVVRVALSDEGLSCALAVAPCVPSSVRAVAALCCALTSLLSPEDIADLAVHAAVRSMIGAPEGRHVLGGWAQVAPAGWGATCAADLIRAVTQKTCDPWSAAALLGPCDDAVALLRRSSDAAAAIKRWGRRDPGNPTAWTACMSSECRRQLYDLLDGSPWDRASCLPWLPMADLPEHALGDDAIVHALHAFADASPESRALHADLLTRLIESTKPEALNALTRLACVTGSEKVWQRIRTLLEKKPKAGNDIVRAAPWNDLPQDIRTTIMHGAVVPSVCDIAVACDHQKISFRVTHENAVLFFAALTPDVWDGLPHAVRREWLQVLSPFDVHVAIRSLGFSTDVLAHATLTNDLVDAARIHASDDDALRQTLLPVAFHRMNVCDAYALLVAMPDMPHDAGAFFAIASGRGDPAIIVPARDRLRTRDDLAAAIALQRCANDDTFPQHCSKTLMTALQGRTWEETRSLLALLDQSACAMITPDAHALAVSLSDSDHRESMRAALNRVACLPPESAIPALASLERWRRGFSENEVACGLAHALRAHGDLFLDVVDTYARDDFRGAMLPLPSHPGQANALRAVTRDHPVAGQRLAHALRNRAWRDACVALLTALPDHAHAVLSSLSDDDRADMLSSMAVRILSLAAKNRTGDLLAAWIDVAHVAPLHALALATVMDDDRDVRTSAVVTLVQAPHIVRRLLPLLHPDIQRKLRSHPVIFAIAADLEDRTPPSIRFFFRRS